MPVVPVAARSAGLAVAQNELLTRDLDASLDFGRDVFGWDYQPMDMPGMTDHVIAGGDEAIGRVMAMPDGFPAQVPSHWLVYFIVADAAAAVARATDLGGTVTHGPDDTPIGILAGLQDPQGGSFSIMQPPSADDTA